MGTLCKALLADDSGQDTIEWVLLALIISVAAATVMFTLGENVQDGYEETNRQVTEAMELGGA